MPMDINIQLSDDDLQFFVKGMREVEAGIQGADSDKIITAAQALLDETRGAQNAPPFISERLDSVESLISMAGDVGFNLPDEDRHRVLAALAYLADPEDSIPDRVPVLGFLDDAIMIELCRRDLQFEIEAYDDFCVWRNDEARARGVDATIDQYPYTASATSIAATSSSTAARSRRACRRAAPRPRRYLCTTQRPASRLPVRSIVPTPVSLPGATIPRACI